MRGTRTDRSASPAAPRGSRSGRAGPFPSQLKSAPLLPLPARPLQQEAGGQPRGGVATPTGPRGLPPPSVPARSPRAGSRGTRSAPRGGDGSPAAELSSSAGRGRAGSSPAATLLPRKHSCALPRCGVPNERAALLTSLAASPAAGLAVAVIHTVQDDQGKGEKAKLHPGPLKWAACSSGSEGRLRPDACGVASGPGRGGGRRSAAG